MLIKLDVVGVKPYVNEAEKVNFNVYFKKYFVKSSNCLSSMLRQAYRGRYCGENCTLIETTPPIFTEQPVICN